MTDKQVSLREAQMRTAMDSPQHLKQWVHASHRRWLVFNTMELIDALKWPEGITAMMDLIQAYTQYRRSQVTGRTSPGVDVLTNEEVQLPIYKDEALEKNELDQAIRYLVAQMRQLDPNWSWEDPAL